MKKGLGATGWWKGEGKGAPEDVLKMGKQQHLMHRFAGLNLTNWSQGKNITTGKSGLSKRE